MAEANQGFTPHAAIVCLKRPNQIIHIVSHRALNPWAGLGEFFAPIERPAHNPFDWEAWLECDVFRAEVEAKLK